MEIMEVKNQNQSVIYELKCDNKALLCSTVIKLLTMLLDVGARTDGILNTSAINLL